MSQGKISVGYQSKKGTSKARPNYRNLPTGMRTKKLYCRNCLIQVKKSDKICGQCGRNNKKPLTRR